MPGKYPEAGSPEYNQIKQQINHEGLEGDGEFGAAVYVGTKEEVEALEKRDEKEGRAENLEAYLRLNKTRDIWATKDNMKEFFTNNSNSKMGKEISYAEKFAVPGNASIFKVSGPREGKGEFLVYFDKDSNLVGTFIEYDNITDYRGRGENVSTSKFLKRELESLKFTFIDEQIDGSPACKFIAENYWKWRDQRIDKENEKKKFDI